MTQTFTEQIAFEVETSRILEILSSEIYDSPQAFLRENVQNAYDAILMRCTAEGTSLRDRRIEIDVDGRWLTVLDDGIGMDQSVLKDNFWKAGSSGKRSALAQRSGVIGTFGIGAMANFGVCTALVVETRHIESEETLISSARRDNLRISQNCIDLQIVNDGRQPGSKIIAELDPEYPLNASSIRNYLRQYVRFLPVPVYVNGANISQRAYDDELSGTAEGFQEVQSSIMTSGGPFEGSVSIFADPQGRILVRLRELHFHGTPISGDAFFVQQRGQIHAYRNFFGLSPVPVSGYYGLSGYVNLDILRPTAGREALSRESIQYLRDLIEFAEGCTTVAISDTDAADRNQQFQNHILSKGWVNLAHRVGINVKPLDEMVALGQIENFEPEKSKLYYAGRDPTTVRSFSGEGSNLFHVAQTNPRRNLQMRYLTSHTRLERVPDELIISKIQQTALTLEEAMFLLRIRTILLDDYLMPDVDVDFAEISHGVSIHVIAEGDKLDISIQRTLPAVAMVTECYTAARDVFGGFVKDFVREHIYPHIRDYVPSSKRQGRDALYNRLKKNKDLFQLEEGDYGEIEPILADFLSGQTDLQEVLRSTRRQGSGYWQHLSNEQIGSVENEFPDIVESPVEAILSSDFEPSPPIMRPDVSSEMKVLTVSHLIPRLNDFQMFLGLSERMVRMEGEFLHFPHTTKLLWGAHRVIYIFTDETGDTSLYYDIELKSPLNTQETGGAMVPSTTIVTKNRIYVPVPNNLQPAFEISAEGIKEFYVRFDTIP